MALIIKKPKKLADSQTPRADTNDDLVNRIPDVRKALLALEERVAKRFEQQIVTVAAGSTGPSDG